MKKINSIIAMALLCTGIAAFSQEQAAPAVEEQADVKKPEVALSLEYRTKYVSKGRVLNPDNIVAADASIEYYGFSFDVWGAADLTSYNDVPAWESNRRYRFEEIDYTIAYNYTFENCDLSPITVGAYWMYMDYPGSCGAANRRDDSAHHETEFGLNASLDNVLDKEGKAGLAFGTDLYINLVDSYYFGDLFADYSYKFNDNFKAGMKFTAYWYGHKARKYKTYYFAGIHDAQASGFAVPNVEFQPYVGYKFNDYISAEVYAATSIALERTTRQFWGSEYGPDGNHSENYWFGAKLGVAW